MAAQLPDKIVYNGESHDLYSNPLEQFWSYFNKKRPQFDPLPDCKRGYRATWEIIDETLFLVEIDGNYEKHSFFLGSRQARYTLDTLFPKSDHKLVKAVWFSGKLRIPQGKMTKYEHNEYDSRFEKEIIVSIEKGEVEKVVTMDYIHQNLIVN